jgi:hypothetical protein
MPLRRQKCCASTPGGPRPPFGPELPHSGRVPPLSFHPTPTVYSAQHLAGLLHPATGHGVRHVSGLARRSSEEGRRACRPRWRQPFEAFPSLTAGLASPRARSLSPLNPGSACLPPVLPPVSGSFSPRRRPQGFGPPGSPLQRLDVAAAPLLDAPMGFCTFRLPLVPCVSDPEGPGLRALLGASEEACCAARGDAPCSVPVPRRTRCWARRMAGPCSDPEGPRRGFAARAESVVHRPRAAPVLVRRDAIWLPSPRRRLPSNRPWPKPRLAGDSVLPREGRSGRASLYDPGRRAAVRPLQPRLVGLGRSLRALTGPRSCECFPGAVPVAPGRSPASPFQRDRLPSIRARRGGRFWALRLRIRWAEARGAGVESVARSASLRGRSRVGAPCPRLSGERARRGFGLRRRCYARGAGLAADAIACPKVCSTSKSVP